MSDDAYARAGVDVSAADRGVRAIVDVLRAIDTGRPSRSVLSSGHYASVLEVAPGLGIALSTDGVGSKLILAEQTGMIDGVGVDCVAMTSTTSSAWAPSRSRCSTTSRSNAPIRRCLHASRALSPGAPSSPESNSGGELAVLPELIRGHPPRRFELSGTAFGTVALERLVTGERCAPATF